MKNLLLVGLMSAALATSCSTAKQAQSDRAETQQLKGTWQITSVDYDKAFKVKPFDEGADAQCWVGSQWKFVPNNWTGNYTLNGGGDCPSVSQPIKFEVVNGNQFQFKKLAAGTKAKQNITGYVLSLIGQTGNNFSLEQNISAGSDNVKITYNFQKVSQ